jgi:DNA processing protein
VERNALEVRPEAVAACALSAVPGLGGSSLGRIAAEFQTLQGAAERGPRAILERADILKLGPRARAYLAKAPDLRELGLWALEAARKAGARVLLLGDDDYPLQLREIDKPPALLYLRGHLQREGRRIAVVGSREADDEGLQIASSMGEDFARAGSQVVSGGARGIDAAAHEGALSASGSTVAVLGCGIDVVYPAENGELFDRIATGGGAVVTGVAPGTPPAQENFPQRNRIISGLADAVVVVRAALKSGALITADHAARQKRPIFAVPGDHQLAAGPNELLRRQKAAAAGCALDVLQGLRWPIPAGLSARPSRAAQETTTTKSTADPDVDRESLQLWRLLDDRKPAHLDDLALRAQIPTQVALRKLADLELKSLAIQRPGKYFLRR